MGESGGFAPRLVLPVQGHLQAGTLRTAYDDDRILMGGSFLSAFGAYDIDPTSIRLSVFDGSGDEIALHHVGDAELRYNGTFDGHIRPVHVIVPWAYANEELPPGAYTLRLSAYDQQGNALAHNETKIILHPETAESILAFLSYLLFRTRDKGRGSAIYPARA